MEDFGLVKQGLQCKLLQLVPFVKSDGAGVLKQKEVERPSEDSLQSLAPTTLPGSFLRRAYANLAPLSAGLVREKTFTSPGSICLIKRSAWTLSDTDTLSFYYSVAYLAKRTILIQVLFSERCADPHQQEGAHILLWWPKQSPRGSSASGPI